MWENESISIRIKEIKKTGRELEMPLREFLVLAMVTTMVNSVTYADRSPPPRPAIYQTDGRKCADGVDQTSASDIELLRDEVQDGLGRVFDHFVTDWCSYQVTS